MKLKFLLIGASLITCAALNAQSIERSVIGAAGGFATSANGSLSWTAGETAISTLSAGSVILTQGFQQPEIPASSIKSVSANNNITVFPNPSNGIFQVKLNQALLNNVAGLNADVFDGSGKLVAQRTVALDQTTGSMDLSHLPSGIYNLRITGAEGTSGIFKLTILN